MKKLLLLIVTLTLAGACSMEEDKHVDFYIEFLKVEDADLPEYVLPGYEYDVIVYYKKPTDCHYFDGFYYYVDGPVCTVAPQSMVIGGGNCAPLENLAPEQATFRFSCQPSYAYNNYIFKFYIGEDEQGNQLFEEKVVPVMN